ncbi:MAG: thiamine pyrophosphate-dependent dehydrogenase E1 component subunit alpha [Deltaproteobacteria bacterium]|nr:thiamine pyrophosphate-dependent dehydrogenase E1 component subunit alpha [Deltaproteobacteria bacterium]
MTRPDREALYRSMRRILTFEEAVRALWQEGRISGEMHLCRGEEALAAGVMAHHREGDAVSCDHRPHGQFVARGVPLVDVLAELLGDERGLCAGRGGHMHLFSRRHLIATTGIVGAPAPLGAGFALALKRLQPAAVAFAYGGDGAANQGLFLETLNLASVWRLPLLLVCKDNGWGVTTWSRDVTAGDQVTRARAFGLVAERVDGMDPIAVWHATERLLAHVRAGRGPALLHARCTRLDGHFLGDRMVRAARDLEEGAEMGRNVVENATARHGGRMRDRLRALARMGKSVVRLKRGLGKKNDPTLQPAGTLGLSDDARGRIDAAVDAEVRAAVAAVAKEAA